MESGRRGIEGTRSPTSLMRGHNGSSDVRSSLCLASGLVAASSSMPKSTGAASAELEVATMFTDPVPYHWFALHVPDDSCRFGLQAELEKLLIPNADKGAARGAPPRAVDMGSLRAGPNCLALRWHQPNLTRNAYAWFKRIVDKSSTTCSNWFVRGYHDLKDLGELTAPQKAPLAPAPSGEAPVKGKRIVSKRKASLPEPRARAAPSGPLSPGAAVVAQWPRYKMRRMLGSRAREAGVGPDASAYRLGKLLGAGGFGEVFLSSLGGFSLAVKVVSEDKMLDALKEVAIAERVAGHPNLVELKDAVVRLRDKASLLVYLYGGSTLEVVSKRRVGASLPIDACLRDCLSGLAYLHRMSLFHTDIKPSNILVEQASSRFVRARLADLGGLVEVCPGQPVAPRASHHHRLVQGTRASQRAEGGLGGHVASGGLVGDGHHRVRGVGSWLLQGHRASGFA